MINFPKNKNGGFTLLETVIAIFILSVAVASLFQLTANSLFAMKIAKNEITATYLAQEAVDYIRNDRDSKMFFGGKGFNEWLMEYGYTGTGMPGQICFSSDGCIVFSGDNGRFVGVSNGLDAPKSNVEPCHNECPKMQFLDFTQGQNGRPADSYFGYERAGMTFSPFWTDTPYTRTVRMTEESAGEIKVEVTVSWKSGFGDHNKILVTLLTHWPAE